MSLPCPICHAPSSPSLTKDNCQYHACSACGFLFARPERSARTVIYDEAYWAMERSAAEARERQDAFIRAMELIYLSAIPVRRVLDFGCGRGITVKMLRDALGIEVVGVDPFGEFEPTEYLLKEPIETLAQKMRGTRFDAIYSIEVFEHLEDPMGVMRCLFRLLCPGGKILINTGTNEFLSQFDPEMQYLDPWVRGHISIYSLESFRAMARHFGGTAEFMSARYYAVLIQKPQAGSAQPLPLAENLRYVERLGPWGPLLFREYMRLVALEEEFIARANWAAQLDAELRALRDS